MDLKTQITELAEVIAAVALKHHDPVADEITERKAKKDFGSRWIAYHNERNHIQWTRKGKCKNSPKVTSRSALLALREAEKIGAQSILKQYKK